eukprot:jgi/Psemu1/285862/fgenesh1_pg.105_\
MAGSASTATAASGNGNGNGNINGNGNVCGKPASRSFSTAESVTKPRAAGKGSNTSNTISNSRISAMEGGELCLALYRYRPNNAPKKRGNSSNDNIDDTSGSIWWPALRFPSIADFQKATQGRLFRDGGEDSTQTNTNTQTQTQTRKLQKRLVRRVLREALGGDTIETICYLGRPLEELEDDVVAETDDFETIWHKHQMEGWDQFLEEDGRGSETMVYKAPNGYRFDSHRDFLRYLLDTYGVSRSRSRDKCKNDGGLQWSDLWLYLTNTLDWTYDYATTMDMKKYGMNTTALWFRPGFHLKHRGVLGKDHFVSEDGVFAYCIEHGIQPPPRETNHKQPASEREPERESEREPSAPSKANAKRPKKSHKSQSLRYEEEEEEDDDQGSDDDQEMEVEVEESENDDDEHGSVAVPSDDDGYATPDDQSTVPQDPGKPRLPSPSVYNQHALQGDSGRSGGSNSHYSYDDDPDRYVFQNLWARLRSKGWTWVKAKNNLDAYWWVKPASMRPVSEWERGRDYFATEDELIHFCRERDELSRIEREKRRKIRFLESQKRGNDFDGANASVNGNPYAHANRHRQPWDWDWEGTEAPRNETVPNPTADKAPKKRKTQAQTQTQVDRPGNTTRPNPEALASIENGTKKRQPKHKDDSESSKKQKPKEKRKPGAKPNTNTNTKTKGASSRCKTKSKTKPPREGVSCDDANLLVDSEHATTTKRRNRTPPWIVDVPQYEHHLAVSATVLTWCNSGYYFPGENRRKYTVRFSSVEEVAEHFARNPTSLVWASGEALPSNDDERAFERLVRYALVPGLQSKWSTIRLITRSETSFLLRKLGYRPTTTTLTQTTSTTGGGAADGAAAAWEPPQALVAGGFLEPRYESLDSLCDALRRLTGDLQTPPTETSRRRSKQESAITSLQFMALRLRMAEGFSDADDEKEDEKQEEEENKNELGEEQEHFENSRSQAAPTPGQQSRYSTAVSKQMEIRQEKNAKKKNKNKNATSIGTQDSSTDSLPSSSEDKTEKETSTKKKKKLTTKSEADGNPKPGHGDGTDSFRLSFEEQTSKGNKAAKKRKRAKIHETVVGGNKERADESRDNNEEEQQLALSPSKIKVGRFRKNPNDNPAPWAVQPPVPPKTGWFKLYSKMGFSYLSGYYYFPGESARCYTARFYTVEQIQVCVCTKGNYHAYLDRLDGEDRELVRRHFRYGHVPGNTYEWRKIRTLELRETVFFLNLLGFERNPGPFGWWRVPEGVPVLEQPTYPTLRALGEALARVPDLQDRTMGKTNRRRSRMTDEDKILSDYQMMALRLRIAEGLEDDHVWSEEEDNCLPNTGVTVNKDERPTEDEESAAKKQEGEEQKPQEKLLLPISSNTIDQFIVDQRSHTRTWKTLQCLGCSYTGRFHLPGRTKGIDTQNELVEFVLERSVSILDWENSTLDATDIEAFVRYLKGFHVRCSYSKLVTEAITMITKENITRFLGEIGIQERNGTYFMEQTEYSEFEVVNMIRSNSDLYALREKESSFMKRRRYGEDSLSKQETLALRLWAALSDLPLTNMPEPAAIGTKKGKQNEACGTVETEHRHETSNDRVDRVAIETATAENRELISPNSNTKSRVETSNTTGEHMSASSNNGGPMEVTIDHPLQQPAMTKKSVTEKEIHDVAQAKHSDESSKTDLEPGTNTSRSGDDIEDFHRKSLISSNKPAIDIEATSTCLPSESSSEVNNNAKSATRDADTAGSPEIDSLEQKSNETSSNDDDAETSEDTATIAVVPTEPSVEVEIENKASIFETVASLFRKPQSIVSPTKDCSKTSFATHEDSTKDITSGQKVALFDAKNVVRPTNDNGARTGSSVYQKDRYSERTGDFGSTADENLESSRVSNQHPTSPQYEYFSPTRKAHNTGPEDFVTPKQRNRSYSSLSKRENDKSVAFSKETCPCFSTLASSCAGKGATTKPYGIEFPDTLGLMTQPSFDGNDSDRSVALSSGDSEGDPSIGAMDRPAKLEPTVPGYIIRSQDSHDQDDWLDKDLFS